jgi:hypothetical protein
VKQPHHWVRRHWQRGGITFLQEVDAEGWTLRQIELLDPDGEPRAAAAADEYVAAMRSPDMETRVAFRRRFGGVADQRMDPDDGRYHGDPISQEEFEREWHRARTFLESREPAT